MIQNCVQQLQPYLRVRALCSYLDKEVGASHNLGLVGLGLVAAELPAYLLLQRSTDLQRRGIRALAVPRKGIRALVVSRKVIRALVVSRKVIRALVVSRIGIRALAVPMKGIRALAVPMKGIRALAVPRKGIRALAVPKNQGISCAQKSIGKYWTIINII